MAKPRKGAAKALKRKPAPRARKVRSGGEAPARKKKSPLSAALFRKFRDKLLSEKERIMGDLVALRQTHLRSSQREATGDLSGYTLHMADVGTDTFDREFSLSVASTEGDILYRIDQAIRRIEEKTYGLCESCGRAIKLARLNAVPWARLCIGCKEAEENGGESS